MMLKVTALQVCETDVQVTVKFYGEERARFSVPIRIVAPGKLRQVTPYLEGSEDGRLVLRESDLEKRKIRCRLTDEQGIEISELSAQLQNAAYRYTISDPSLAQIADNGEITPLALGQATVRAEVTIGEVTVSGEMTLTISEGKGRSSYYTAEKIQNARANAQIYPWARSAKETAVALGDQYAGMEDKLWNLVTTQELPRSYYVGYRNDPQAGLCRYCGANIAVEFGSLYAWIKDPLTMPWKVQCPKCRRKFPSNDFGSFYQLGIDEHGNFSYEQAKQKNAELVAAGQPGYLVNIEFPEMDKTLGIQGWGVDDGYGYRTGHTYSNGVEEVHTYISHYNHFGIWHEGIINTALRALKDAYLYTGDAKYGRTGAILLDRIADVYPAMDTRPYRWQLTADASYAPKGKIVDLVWENQYAEEWSFTYDLFFPMYQDAGVIQFLSGKAERYQLENPKTSAGRIRENCEDGILREIFKGAQSGMLNGNFGMTQSAVANSAVALDTMPETKQMIDWIFQDGEKIYLYPSSAQADVVTGGNVQRQIIDNVDRDGISDEIAPGYASIWVGGLISLINSLAGYDRYAEMDLYSNPRVIKMLTAMYPLTLSRRATAQIGDSGAVADNTLAGLYTSRAIPAYQNTKRPEFAQIIYFMNGNKTEGLHYDVFTENPESLAADVRETVKQYGEYNFDQSGMLAGYGFAALRGGIKLDLQDQDYDTQRTFWMNFTRANASHAHYDGLNLGIEAYGLNIAPELGYPHKVIGDLYYYWGSGTVSHNTVVVGKRSQKGVPDTGKPLHFDDAGRVQVMDARAPERYDAVSEYRRTLVSVDVDDEVSYGVDFFRVTGGDEQVYSFHALTDLRPTLETLDGAPIPLTPQTDQQGNYIGSYDGPNTEFQAEGVISGYSYLKNVDRAANPGSAYTADFTIKDFRKTLSAPRDVHLRLTALNDFAVNELAVAMGEPGQANGNPTELTFLLQKRTGSNLDSLFTTVFEPYDGESSVQDIRQVPVRAADGSAAVGTVKAVKVSLKNGRVDYIVYAENNQVEYLVDDLFPFQGFVGVYSLKDGENVYAYLNDGTTLGQLNSQSAYTGTVEDFTKELAFHNTITVSLDQSAAPEELAGKWVYIENGVSGNGAYAIRSARRLEDGRLELDIGDVTLIDSLKSAEAGEYQYHYNIQPGAALRIPLSALVDNSPVFEPVADQRVIAGKKISCAVNAESPSGRALAYEGVILPRGARFDPLTHTFSWTPDARQIGTHHVAISATDGALTTTLHFSIQVYQGQQGGDSPGPKPGDKEPPVVTPPEKDPPEEDAQPRFTDLDGYDWAVSAINRLAEADIIRGTSENTFSPGKNITRADFAILLVRAFGLSGEASENFADVDPQAYYARELAIAKENRIIDGVGGNRFQPDRTISRQDMLLILARTLNNREIPLTQADGAALAGFSDAAQISGYAMDAVALMAKNGLVAGDQGRLRPLDPATRAETAVLLERVLQKAQILE